MNKLKKLLVYGCVSMMFMMSASGTVTAFAESSGPVAITPYRDIIEWRYKVMDSKLYKRQYNASKRKWVGEWQFVANVIG